MDTYAHPCSLAPRGLRRSPGFTIIELLVSSVVMLIMMVLIGQMFMNTSRAVGQGVSMSDVVGRGRTAGTQFDEDAAAMIGPHTVIDGTLGAANGGFLVIVNRIIGDDDNDGIFDAGEGVLTPHPRGGDYRRPVISDELTFVRYGNDGSKGIYPLTPKTDNGYFNDVIAPHIRVWYGHALRTNTDGTTAGGLGASGPNERSTQWVLARQAMFLDDDDLTGYIHLNGAWVDAEQHVPPPNAALRFNYMGLTDVAEQSLANHLAASATQNGIIIGGDSADAAYAAALTPDQQNQVLWSVVAGFAEDEYKRRALRYTYGYERLRVNLSPQFDPASPQFNYAAWQVGQTHAAFLEHASDFIVEFAADISAPGGTTYAPDGKVDTVSAAEAAASGGVIPEGSIKWYSAYDNSSTPPVSPSYIPLLVPGTGSYSVPGSGTGATYPTPADYPPAVATADLPAGARGAFIWRHDRDDAGVASTEPAYCDWPYLIRIRYRLHDPRGELTSGVAGSDTVAQLILTHGIWFEHVIPVKRPYAP